MNGRLKKMMSSGIPVLALIWLLFALLCIIYGVIVESVGSGTGFFVVWLGLGFVFIVFACIANWHLWMHIPGIIRKAFLALTFLSLAAFLIIEGLIITGANSSGKKNLDYVIVLGAQMRSNGPSKVLQFRLDQAIQYLNENPDTICIVTGGQGYNEPCTEAEGMATYLEKKGIDSSRILKEDDSHTTEENMKNSKRIIEEREAGKSQSKAEAGDGQKSQSKAETGDEEKYTVGIITNNFHMYRALQIAKKTGFEDYCGISAPTTILFLPNNFLREFFAEIKFLLTSL